MYSKVKVKCGRKEWDIEINKKQNLLEVLQENNIKLGNICHGNGTCGKCKIKVLSGELPITAADRNVLTDEEVQQGIRLACKVKLANEQGNSNKGEEKYVDIPKELNDEKYADIPKELNDERCANVSKELWVEILEEDEENIVVESLLYKKIEKENCSYAEERSTEEQKSSFFIAIDIGTTTIAMALVNEETGEICDTYTSLNHQRKYGADVISRIVASNDGKVKELKQLIEQDLWEGISILTKKKKDNADAFVAESKTTDVFSDSEIGQRREISRIVIAGNTTMIHLLRGYSCESLGKYPFVSEHLENVECTLKECIITEVNENLLKDSLRLEFADTPIAIFPGISAFVGGDVVAGILSCSGFETEEICLLIDLGTNGEIVLGNKEQILVASTAAGPAFEGGNITCGIASVPGSIEKVKIQNQKAVIRTIKNEMPPKGICGTGLVSMIAQLKEHKIMDYQGNLQYPYNENGFSLWVQSEGESIKLYQKDIREFQMAKAAIRAGVEILLKEYGCQIDEVKKIYLAGGFGTHLSEEDVISTGILPEEFRSKIMSIGNGALQGAIQAGIELKDLKQKEVQKFALNADETRTEDAKKTNIWFKEANKIIDRAKNISLAEHEMFQEYYLRYMEF